jgi:hypothetical protein
MVSRWDAYLADPAMVACTSRSDCIVVGGQPAMDPCNGHSTIGYCGKATNAAAYRASPAASLETEFAATCTDHEALDCGPGVATCTNGVCRMEGWACCHCPPDAGRPDTPLAADGSTEVGAGEAGGRETSVSEAGGGEAGAGQ